MKFRQDIAGLRAVAVLPILIFHAGANWLPGGFIGVDIFFVISGFLITSLIVKDLKSEEFSILSFYRRRIVRILPALILVILATLLASLVVMLPSEIRELSRSATSALAFVSNIYLFLTADYFGAAAESMPLLHTWSLAVEEQFYIFYPLLLIFMWRRGLTSIKTTVLSCTIISFFIAHILSAYRPDAAFYLLPARAWELGIGAMVALGIFPEVRSKRGKNIAAGFGLMLILGAIFLMKETTLFPAPLAAVPVMGTALLIAYGQEAFTSPILSLKPMRWIGNISYSLYLWHWPIITLYRLKTGIDLSPYETIILVSSSILLAAVSYHLIEKPFLRNFRHTPSIPDRNIVLAGVASIIFLTLLSTSTKHLNKIILPIPRNVELIASFMDYRETNDYSYQFRKGLCFMGESDPQTINRECLTTSKTKPNIVVMGDSHAAQFWRAIAERYSEYHVIQATASGCRPLINGQGAARCTKLMQTVFSETIPSGDINTVILAGRWSRRELKDIKSTVEALTALNIRVMVIGPTVEYQGDYPAILARAIISGNSQEVERLRVKARQDLEKEIEVALASTNALFIPLHDLICNQNGCTRTDSTGAPYQFDYGHLTLNATREIVSEFPPL